MPTPRRLLQNRSQSSPAAPTSRTTRRHSAHRRGTPAAFSFPNLPIKAPTPAQTADEAAEPAPAPLRPQGGIDYERLLGDGELSITLAVGHDSRQSRAADRQERETNSGYKARNLREWLQRNDIKRVDPDSAQGTEHYEGVRSITYPGPDGVPKTRSVKIRVSLIVPGKGAADEYEKALNDSEITLYSGHSRGGLGPDFDRVRSALGNFVLGAYSEQHKSGKLGRTLNSHAKKIVTDHVNDLERMTKRQAWTPDRYRIWFFNACSSLLYLRSIRGGLLPPDMGRSNLGFFGTDKPVSGVGAIRATLDFLEGLFAGRSSEQIVGQMNATVDKRLEEVGTKGKKLENRIDPYFGEGGTVDAAP